MTGIPAAQTLLPSTSAAALTARRWKGERTPMNTRGQSAAPDAIAPMRAEIFQSVTARSSRQAASDLPSASISLRPGRCSLAGWLRQIAATRAGLRHTLRRPGERLWLLLHAPSLLDGPGSTAPAIALPEDDYHRLAARQHETRARRARGAEPHDTANVRPFHKQRQRNPSHE
jgi:hypothetical protein